MVLAKFIYNRELFLHFEPFSLIILHEFIYVFRSAGEFCVNKILVVAFGLVVTSCAKRPQVAYNYLLNKQGQRISWKFNKPVDMLIRKSFYYIDPDDCEIGAEYMELVYKAASIWERRVNTRLFNIRESDNYSIQDCRDRKEDEKEDILEEVQKADQEEIQEDGQKDDYTDGESVIYWMKDWKTNRSREQARTSTRWIGTEIIEADVSINNFHHSFYDSECESGNGEYNLVDKLCGDELTDDEKSKVHFISLMIHEMGHVLGQSHAKDVDSVMQSILRSDELRDVIAVIDAERILVEYDI